MPDLAMERTANDPRVIITSGGTFCLFDDAGRMIGTIERPVVRQPLGAGRETVFLNRGALREGVTAA